MISKVTNRSFVSQPIYVTSISNYKVAVPFIKIDENGKKVNVGFKKYRHYLLVHFDRVYTSFFCFGSGITSKREVGDKTSRKI